MQRIVIVGVGFGGLAAAQTLAKKDVQVLLIDEANYYLFHPLLYQVATASVEQENIAYPIRAIIRGWPNSRFKLARVTGIDVEERHVVTQDGEEIPYDHLIVAAGSVTNFFGMQDAEDQSHTLKQLEDAVRLRSHILRCFEEAAETDDKALRSSLLTFVVVGAGPTGVEFSGALAELVRHTLAKDYPELSIDEVRVELIEALDTVLPPLPETLRTYAHRRLEHLGVTVRLGQPVTSVNEDTVCLRGDCEIRTKTLFWAAGVRPSFLADDLPVPRARDKRVVVEPDLSLPDHPEVFVVGDMTYFEQDGQPLPMLAPVAMQQGRHAARQILARIQGEPTRSFKYKDKGSMAIIGRNHAVAESFGIKMKGFIAWVAWLALHLYYLIGFRNRIMALLNWGYAYILRDPKLRLITDFWREDV